MGNKKERVGVVSRALRRACNTSTRSSSYNTILLNMILYNSSINSTITRAFVAFV